jgi:hypothetical protein
MVPSPHEVADHPGGGGQSRTRSGQERSEPDKRGLCAGRVSAADQRTRLRRANRLHAGRVSGGNERRVLQRESVPVHSRFYVGEPWNATQPLQLNSAYKDERFVGEVIPG